jgi:esterase/lipase
MARMQKEIAMQGSNEARLGPRHRPSGENSHFMGEGLGFGEYVRSTTEMLRRVHSRLGTAELEKVVAGNAPFELHPDGNHQGVNKPYRRGILLTHGLLDSPYFMRHLAEFFRRNGFRVMAPLLPGHGTQPGDLLGVRWGEWQRAVRYGVECLAAEVDELYLAGYSAGATLSLLHSASDERVRGLFLFAPALEISPRARWANLHKLYSWLLPEAAWVRIVSGRDLYKYESLCKNAAAQMYALTQALPKRLRDIPVFAVASADDATVNAAATLRFMRQARHPHCRLVWYADQAPQFDATCVEWVNSVLPEWRILSSAHTAIVLPPEDEHYGVKGSYVNCLHYYPHDMESYEQCHDGACDVWHGEVNERNLANGGLLCRLMFNPHYAAMEASMRKFIEGLP